MKWYGIIGEELEAFERRQEEEIAKCANFDYQIIFKTSDKSELLKKLEELGATDETHCIEIFEGDEAGEFVSGSDYDSPSNFLKNIEMR